MDNELPSDVSNPVFQMDWKPNTPLPDVSKLDEQLDQNIAIMMKELQHG